MIVNFIQRLDQLSRAVFFVVNKSKENRGLRCNEFRFRRIKNLLLVSGIEDLSNSLTTFALNACADDNNPKEDLKIRFHNNFDNNYNIFLII